MQTIPNINDGSDPDAALLDWLTNATYDNLTNNPEHPMSDEEEAILMGEGGYETKIPKTDLIYGASVIWREQRCFLHSVEFHYRNDGTREMWSSNPTMETKLPSRETQTEAIKRSFAHAYPIASIAYGGTVVMNFCEHVQPDGRSTDDRHIMYIILPIDKVMERHSKPDELHAALLEMIGV